mmetsp:Transcript_36065/g.60772  ORF Transcript_36065/g.60772 Transcript_36065/m.60772 type:complete len:282 (-) Transcript_36065:230-1075(-)
MIAPRLEKMMAPCTARAPPRTQAANTRPNTPLKGFIALATGRTFSFKNSPSRVGATITFTMVSAMAAGETWTLDPIISWASAGVSPTEATVDKLTRVTARATEPSATPVVKLLNADGPTTPTMSRPRAALASSPASALTNSRARAGLTTQFTASPVATVPGVSATRAKSATRSFMAVANIRTPSPGAHHSGTYQRKALGYASASKVVNGHTHGSSTPVMPASLVCHAGTSFTSRSLDAVSCESCMLRQTCRRLMLPIGSTNGRKAWAIGFACRRLKDAFTC